MPTRPAAPALEFVVVRHAEKASDDPRDPQLSDAGRARAQRLATALAAQPLVAAYATAYRRSQQTAAPAAARHGLAVTAYDARQDVGAFAAALRQRHARGTVLVVGHSNTVPGIAAALCGCTVAPLGDDEFDRRLSVRFDRDGTATLVDARVP
jgi:broad specificity phosphatase PhoE